MSVARRTTRRPVGPGLTQTQTQLGRMLASLEERLRRGMGLRALTASDTAKLTDGLLTCDATSGAITVTLPKAKKMRGQTLHAIKTDAGANALTLDGDGSETINGAATQNTTTQWDMLSVVSDGTQWYLL